MELDRRQYRVRDKIRHFNIIKLDLRQRETRDTAATVIKVRGEKAATQKRRVTDLATYRLREFRIKGRRSE